ncbi:acetyl-CoA synthetase [Yamadazyma tenuis]|uniref:Acetyl-coenzyme A synthetase n=1 Tax=Candida tenuis (strain ATCC 10573 / BCRC 21748 / CBS 615 / JCM 9827 / NBRC 10315 / NRRL Y-1498 / VKM Y-70) TaxID=590646 RepID=G3B9T5_CANTC|nr:acetyl-coenzyme A synthetase 1 [Yamadazyma tenuis ATCC 10573]EGV61966.1 acetyl-coenzyme A synthetase 1 [Yamadazyma tenuis ATCC 10573]WEJ93213.1 acetyl-CoA synthetase [Yamadazyma tenuis]
MVESHVTLDHEKMQLPPDGFKERSTEKPNLASFEEYQTLYKESVEDPSSFFGKMGSKFLDWERPFDLARYPVSTENDFKHGDIPSWFINGKLNASYNTVDRWAFKNPNKPAIIYEGDEPDQGRIITYGELLKDVSKMAQCLTKLGVKKGDSVAVYLPMIPEAIVTLLAIVRIGAIHSVVFAGFSSSSLKDRILDANSKIVVTADESKRGGKTIETKKIVDDALKQCPDVTNVLVFKRTGNSHVPFFEGRDLWWHNEMDKYGPYFPPVPVDSEDPLFLLYTSGSTGKPKGVQHNTAGYLLGAMLTTKYVFDVHESDIVFTAGDVGWITGHSYVVYGPLLNGATTVVFEGTPAYPNYSRYWDIVDKYKVNIFYVAPTALRLLKRAGTKYIENYKLDSLRVLGSVGEPIAAEVWHWYNDNVGRGKAHIVDTYWQTESGSHLMCPLAGVTPTKPGSCSLPFFGIVPKILDPVNGHELNENDVEGVLAIKNAWPSITRGIFNDYSRYIDTYLKPYPNHYFSGDGAARDKDGFYWILGRVDDVVNVSGHRLSTAEIEAALIEHELVGESAVVGYADDLTGQAVAAYVSLKSTVKVDDVEAVKKELILTVRKEIGPFAAPKLILLVDDLPKTRSGKIMRRILRKVLAGEEDQLGDISTLSNPGVVEQIINVVKSAKK